MGNLNSQCPFCLTYRSVAYETSKFYHFACYCGGTWVRLKESKMSNRFVVIRDDNNKILTSIEQATHVAEKLAAENPSHVYYVGKLIKESKVNSVTTIDLE